MMFKDDLFSDCQPQADSGPGAGNLIEPFKDMSQMVGMNSGAIVGDRDSGSIGVILRGDDAYFAAGRAVLNRIVQQVIEYLFQSSAKPTLTTLEPTYDG